MKGDFSRSSFRPGKRYTSVRMQQGRVQLDSDWNEQADIMRHALATQTCDLIGTGAGPNEGVGFALTPAMRTVAGAERPDLTISSGCYYVDGLRCDNDAEQWYSDLPGAASDPLPVAAAEGGRFLAYLEASERLVTVIEDPALRESALGGPDTTVRTVTAWQIRLLPLAAQVAPEGDAPAWEPEWQSFTQMRAHKGSLALRFDGYAAALGNQLYRIEIHSPDAKDVSFKWSRENGALAFPITSVQDSISDSSSKSISAEGRLELSCALIERDRLALVAGDLVEIEDDLTATGAARSLLARVIELRLESGADDQIGTISANLSLSAEAAELAALRERWQPTQAKPGQTPPYLGLHPLLRRWDRNGEVADKAGWKPQQIASDPSLWYPLERGLAIRFDPQSGYTHGDYWQIAARTDTPPGEQPARPPDGIVRRCAPLALLSRRAGSWQVEDLRRCYRSLPQLGTELDRERQRIDVASQEIAQLHADLAQLRAYIDQLKDEMSYLHRKVKDVRGRLYQDYRCDDQLDPGVVVAIDPLHEGYIVKCERANETLLIGVVHEVLIEHGQLVYRVVVYGRVACKVVGEVEPGNLLVVASVEGHACRGGIYLRPGSVIGKALTGWVADESGTPGMVDLIVTLA